MARRLSLVAVLFALLVPAAAAQGSIWTPLSSGTTDTISAIVYQSPTRFWYATTNGGLAFWNGNAFVAGTCSPTCAGEDFVDLAFQPGGLAGSGGSAGVWGYAVTRSGHVWQTGTGGATWKELPPLRTPSNCVTTSLQPVAELNAVVWADPNTAYLMGDAGTLQKSSAAATSAPIFTEINKNGSGTCAAQNETSPTNFSDAVFLPSNPSDGFVESKDFGYLYQTSTGFSSGSRVTPDSSFFVNNFDSQPRVALDAANPNRLWGVDHEIGGGGCGRLCLTYSNNGGLSAAGATFPNDDAASVGMYEISSQGGVEVAAGSGGEIFTSVDGSNFYLQRADGALATENWQAEDAYDATHAAVGGAGGALVVTSQANTIPDIIAPAGAIAGPTTVDSGKAVTFTANLSDNAGGSGVNPASVTWTVPGFPAQHGGTATYTFPRGTGSAAITLTFADNAGNVATTTLNVDVVDVRPASPPPPSGLNPVTRHAGGATIVIYKTVIITGRRGRYVPVQLSSKHGRRFAASVLTTAKRHRSVASAGLTLRRAGHRTLRITLAGRVKPGTYVLRIHVSPLKGHGGGTVTVRFTLR